MTRGFFRPGPFAEHPKTGHILNPVKRKCIKYAG